jgi:hypothetical protein
MIGFIIIRHVNSEKTNLLWQECYRCIRKFYNNKIIIIDDNSNEEFLTSMIIDNTEIIQSEFPKRGELLPYYYFLKYAWFDNAVILHDSVFIQKAIKFDKDNKFLWHFSSHEWDNSINEINLIKKLSNNTELLNFYNKKEEWYGCFGVMSFISYNTIHNINSKYNFFTLLKFIQARNDRMMLERIFAAILWYENDLKKDSCSYFGNIQNYCKWNFSEKYTMNDYLEDKAKNQITLSIVKLWSGR